MRTPLIADCRNLLERERVLEAGFAYFGVGTAIAGREFLVPRTFPIGTHAIAPTISAGVVAS